MRGPGAAALLAVVMLAGCLGGGPVHPSGAPHAWQPDHGAVWMTWTAGCGFCWETDRAWAQTLVLYESGSVMRFSFRPLSGLDEEPIDGVEIPPEYEVFRPELEEAINILGEDDVYWVRQGDARIYDVAAGSLAAGDWSRIETDLQRLTRGLQDPPEIQDYGCEDCGATHVQVRNPAASGAIQVEGRFGPGTGNVPAGGDWDRIEQQLRVLRGWLAPP